MKLKFFWLLLLIVSTNVSANNSPIPLLRNILYEVNSINKVSPNDAIYIVNNNLLALFDIGYMTDHILNTVNTPINKKTRENIEAFVTKNLANTLLYQLKSKNLYNFRISSVLPIAYNVLRVKVKVNSSSSPFPININLILRNDDDNWSIIDILISNASLLSYYKRSVLIKLRKSNIINNL